MRGQAWETKGAQSAPELDWNLESLQPYPYSGDKPCFEQLFWEGLQFGATMSCNESKAAEVRR
jgi:hypothetical protein